MTNTEIKTELDKLNKSQFNSLVNLLANRGLPTYIEANSNTGGVAAEFTHESGKKFMHNILMTRRGRVIVHEINRSA